MLNKEWTQTLRSLIAGAKKAKQPQPVADALHNLDIAAMFLPQTNYKPDHEFIAAVAAIRALAALAKGKKAKLVLDKISIVQIHSVPKTEEENV